MRERSTSYTYVRENRVFSSMLIMLYNKDLRMSESTVKTLKTLS